jgi:hypothetical protein
MPGIVSIFFGGSVAEVDPVVLPGLEVLDDALVEEDCAVTAAARNGDEAEDGGGHDETSSPPEIGAPASVQSTQRSVARCAPRRVMLPAQRCLWSQATDSDVRNITR